MPLTPEEQDRIAKVFASFKEPSVIGEGFGPRILIYMYKKLVALQDLADAQITINKQLNSRVRQLELLAARIAGNGDAGEVYLSIDVIEDGVGD